MITVKLFVTAGCHLCDLALIEIANSTSSQHLQIEQIEIGDDDVLLADYGIRIPVLQFVNGDELDWPFNHADIRAKLGTEL